MKNRKKPPIGTMTPILTGKYAQELFDEVEKPIVWTPEKRAEIERCKKLAKKLEWISFYIW